MILKTILLEDNVNFVDSTKKQNTYFILIILLIANIIYLFLFSFLFKYLNE